MKKKILILGNSNLTVFNFRGEIIDELIKNGYDVVTAFPNGPFGDGSKEAKKHKCKFIEISINRRGKNPFEDIKLLNSYIKIIRNEKPACVLAFTVKCDIYGGIACRILNVPFVPNITGLGKGLTEGKITKKITKFLYKISIKKAKCVFFQNEEDKHFFIKSRIKFGKSVVLPGSGVNLKKFKPLPYPNDNIVRFIYVGRLMKAKGIEEYLEAARKIMRRYDNVEFHICGYCEEDYKNIIMAEANNKIIIYHGLVDDVSKYVKMCHCVVLPSYHPEGISNVLLEAAAMARPIITTDRVGCKETIIDKKTGFLVNEKSVDDLVRMIICFLNMSNINREKMGILGRKYIEEKFDRNIVVERYFERIG